MDLKNKNDFIKNLANRQFYEAKSSSLAKELEKTRPDILSTLRNMQLVQRSQNSKLDRWLEEKAAQKRDQKITLDNLRKKKLIQMRVEMETQTSIQPEIIPEKEVAPVAVKRAISPWSSPY